MKRIAWRLRVEVGQLRGEPGEAPGSRHASHVTHEVEESRKQGGSREESGPLLHVESGSSRVLAQLFSDTCVVC